MDVSLAGRVALITGAGRGIGREIARGVAAAGAAVGLVDVSAEGAEATAAELISQGRRATAHAADVSRRVDVERAVAEVVASHGGLDILCNVAGIELFKPVADTAEEEWDRVLDINLKGMFLMTRAAIPHLRARGRGRILNMASSRGLHGQKGAAAYAASKGGVIAFTRSLALELAPLHITVNALAPGATDTAMWQSSVDAETAERVRRSGQLGQPGDLVPAAVFLLSEHAAQITGHLLVRDIYMPREG